MYENDKAVIRVEACFLEGGDPDMRDHDCKVLTCSPEEDDIKLLLYEDDITVISLDCVYLCRIDSEEGPVYSRITFYKRFLNKLGCVICARINSGFTKKV